MAALLGKKKSAWMFFAKVSQDHLGLSPWVVYRWRSWKASSRISGLRLHDTSSKNLLMDLLLMGCFPGDAGDGKLGDWFLYTCSAGKCCPFWQFSARGVSEFGHRIFMHRWRWIVKKGSTSQHCRWRKISLPEAAHQGIHRNGRWRSQNRPWSMGKAH